MTSSGGPWEKRRDDPKSLMLDHSIIRIPYQDFHLRWIVWRIQSAPVLMSSGDSHDSESSARAEE